MRARILKGRWRNELFNGNLAKETLATLLVSDRVSLFSKISSNDCIRSDSKEGRLTDRLFLLFYLCTGNEDSGQQKRPPSE